MECNDTCDLLILLKLQEVLHIGTLGGLSTLWDFKCLYVVCLTLVCNKCDEIMAGTDKEMINVVTICQFGSDSSLSSLSNCLILGSRETLSKAFLGDVDDNIFFLDEIFRRSVVKLLVNNDSSSFISILFTNISDLFLYDFKNMTSIGKNVVVFSNSLLDFSQFTKNLVCFKVAQSSKLHVNDGISLNLSKIKGLLKLKRSNSVISTVLDDFDDSVDILKTFLETNENVFSFLSLLEIKSCSSFNDFFSVVDINLEHVLDVEEFWCTIIEGKIVDIKVRLKSCLLPKHVQNNVWNCI